MSLERSSFIKLTKHGLWVGRRGKKKRIGWWVVGGILSFVLIFCLVLVLSIDRSFPLLGYALTAKSDAQRDTVKDFFFSTHAARLKQALRGSQPPADSQLPTLSILVEDDTITRMLRARRAGDPTKGREPGGDRPYFEAVYIDETGKDHEAKASSRGYSRHHFHPDKPSLRIKINKSDVTRGYRFVELSRPEGPVDLTNMVAEQYADELGLMTSRRELVRVFINQRYKGVYVRHRRPGEPLALSHGRLNGTWFKGDRFNTKGHFESIWGTTQAWRLSGEDNPYLTQFFQKILDFLALPRENRSATDLDLLWEMIDFEKSAAVSAINTVVGSTHTDLTHNHVLFSSSYSGKLEPLVWDSNGYITDPPDYPVNLKLHPLNELYQADPKWVHQRNLFLHELLPKATGEAFSERAKKLYGTAKADLAADPAYGVFIHSPLEAIMKPMDPSDWPEILEEKRRWVEARHQFLSDFLERAEYAVLQNDGDGISVASFGNSAVKARRSSGEITLLYPGLSVADLVAVSPRGGVPASHSYRIPVPIIYRLPPGQYDFSNAVTGQPALEKPMPTSGPPVWSISRPNLPPLPPVVIGPGKFELTQTFKSKPGQDVEIRPGTELLMGPGVSLIALGNLTALGQPDQPIVIRGGPEGWGCLAAQGVESVRLSYLDVEGGGEVYHLGSQFKGMVSLYECDSVEIDHCRFGANSSGDDAVNIALSEAHIRDSTWESGGFDGLDLDAVDAVIENSKFVNCGNDGLDLMACRVVLRNSELSGNGDKGASVGEGTSILGQDNTFARNKIGLQCKDGSTAVLEDCRFQENELALSAYRKKWIFSRGGAIGLEDCRFLQNERDREFDSTSESLTDREALTQWKTAAGKWADEGFPSRERNLLK